MAPGICFAENTTVVIADDDPTIHKLWEDRFSKVSSGPLVHLSTPEQVFDWFARNTRSDFIFLCDYNFRGDKVNGFELISRLGLSNRSILVTNSYEDDSLLKLCRSVGVRLLPKDLAPYVPLRTV